MTLKLYNSMGRKLEPFRPIEEGKVRMYTCGPTVWNYPHIGNYKTYVFEDVLRRYLKFKGYEVTQVMNITDVEDNIIKGIRQTKMSLKELTSLYESAFFKGLDSLGVERAEVYPRATEHIPEMVELVKTLMKDGYAYKSEDGSIYFDISKFRDYGKLSGVDISEQRSTGRVASDHYEEKKEGVDFALWKAWDSSDGEVFWMTDLGKGRPGWSIECSAMSMKYLGASFDIHTGGIDNKFPHHENEIAQSEAATGKKFVNYWLHSGHLFVGGGAMHKSVGNVVYLDQLSKDGWDMTTVRMFLIGSHYRDSVDLTDAALEQARSRRNRLQDFVDRLRTAGKGDGNTHGFASELLEGFTTAMDEDLDTPGALASVFETAKKVNVALDRGEVSATEARELLDALERVNSVLRVADFGVEALPPEIADMIAQRDSARKKGDYKESDRLRDELLARGFILEDTPKGTVWKRRTTG